MYGEPHKQLSANHGRDDAKKKVVYTQEDMRFTRSKDEKTVNVIVLGWPDAEFTVKSIQVDAAGSGAEIELLGSQDPVSYRINNKQQLVIIPPSKKPHDYAYSFQLTGFELSAHPEADPDAFMKREDDGGGFSNAAE